MGMAPLHGGLEIGTILLCGGQRVNFKIDKKQWTSDLSLIL